MPHGFSTFEQGCPGLRSLGFRFDDSGCDLVAAGYALYKECDAFTCPKGQFQQATYNGSILNAGPAIRISAASVKNNASLLAAIYVPSQSAIALVLWQGQSLISFNDSMVIDKVIFGAVPGDVLRIEADTVDETIYRVKTNGSTVITQTISAGVLPTTQLCVGFVVVHDVPDLF